MPLSPEAISHGLAFGLSLLCIHMSRWFIAVLLSSEVTPASKLLAAVVYACAAGAAHFGGAQIEFAALGLGLLYFGALACATHYWLADLVRNNRVSAAALFVICVGAFQLLPALVQPGIAVLMLGWSMALSSFSYCMDTARLRERPSLKECLFFILVNPCLVFSERGRKLQPAQLNGKGMLRAAAGVGVLCFAFAVLEPVFSAESELYAGLGFEPRGLIAMTLHAVLWFVLQYGQQSGLASVHIGLMRQLGHEIPECYHYPFLARSPADLWRRWNIYFGSWIKRYVFYPLALKLGRNGIPPSFAQASALLIAFVIVGALHDGFSYVTRFELTMQVTLGFLIACVTVLLSAASGLLWQRAVQRWQLPPLHWLRISASRLTLAISVVVSAMA